MHPLIIGSVTIIVVILGLLILTIWLTTFQPKAVQTEVVRCAETAPVLKPGQRVKLLTYNVQFMAGKNYVFFFDLPDLSGPDERPSTADITHTLDEVARIIRDEAPDIILLQEVDEGAARTDYEDQVAQLLERLPADYACHTSAFYWQAIYVPHPRIRGAVGNKLSVISKYRLESATRYQLPLAPADPLTRQFTHKRALFEVRIPIADYSDLVILATHLEVSSKGAKVKQQEVSAIQKHLQKHTEAEALWILGGDFNLLPPGQRERLPEVHQAEFRPDTELQPLLDRYQSVPSREDLRNSLGTSSFTMFHNAPLITAPDRTLDYIFYTDQLTLERGYVRHHDTLAISDHLPVVAEFTLPKD